MMDELYINIQAWATERNIIGGCTMKDQYAKLMSEFGELCLHVDELAEVDEARDVYEIGDKIKDDIGDCIVVLTILAAQNSDFIGHMPPGVAVRGSHEHTCLLRLGRSLGLLGDAIAKKQPLDISIAIAASVDYLSGIASDCDMKLSECVAAAYDDIKDRKGVMYNGTFIKESDPVYDAAYTAVFCKGE